MLKLLQAGTVGRVVYLALLALIVAFDFAKDPIEDYLARSAEGLKSEIYASDFEKSQGIRDSLRTTLRPGGDSDAANQAIGSAIAQSVATGAKTSAVGAGHIGIVVAIGFASIVAALWLVFARVRDIGWPVAVGLAVLAPSLLLRLFGPGMPDLVWYTLQYGMMGALVVIGLVPTGFGQPRAPAHAAPVAARRTAQFSRRS